MNVNICLLIRARSSKMGRKIVILQKASILSQLNMEFCKYGGNGCNSSLICDKVISIVNKLPILVCSLA